MMYRGFTQPGYDASSSLPIYPSSGTGSSAATAPASSPTSSGGYGGSWVGRKWTPSSSGSLTTTGSGNHISSTPRYILPYGGTLSPSTGSSTTAPASTPTSSGGYTAPSSSGGYTVPATSAESSGGYASLLSQLAAGSGSSSAGSGSTSSSIFSGINWTLIIILIAAVLVVKYLFGGK